jgi:hypothetical protein
LIKNNIRNKPVKYLSRGFETVFDFERFLLKI